MDHSTEDRLPRREHPHQDHWPPRHHSPRDRSTCPLLSSKGVLISGNVTHFIGIYGSFVLNLFQRIFGRPRATQLPPRLSHSLQRVYAPSSRVLTCSMGHKDYKDYNTSRSLNGFRRRKCHLVDLEPPPVKESAPFKGAVGSHCARSALRQRRESVFFTFFEKKVVQPKQENPQKPEKKIFPLALLKSPHFPPLPFDCTFFYFVYVLFFVIFSHPPVLFSVHPNPRPTGPPDNMSEETNRLKTGKSHKKCKKKPPPPPFLQKVPIFLYFFSSCEYV